MRFVIRYEPRNFDCPHSAISATDERTSSGVLLLFQGDHTKDHYNENQTTR